VVSRAGSRLPAHATAVGLVLLAHAGKQAVDNIVAHPLKRFTKRTIVDPKRIRAVLADVRRDGYAISEQAIESVSTSIAAPIYGPEVSVVAGLSIVVPSTTEDVRRLVPLVVAAANGASKAMGRPTV
jgi:DNA-binding IclR family transcriptional regulator